ncbi:glutathione-dependent formaldehyde-activating enzyme [Colletotrichum scovillei]|uniref:Glutathione-dependent formaldehyde-activating enzyme n=1 Tax=Colletotrichum scovillei TaxID=1209932 RepID=A0A9P7R4I8_9PEZI|nr:glutathione-dependent formaldehyde-activating enzyme [Colletotrichum scovillei]KAG7065733.1 glutathione-dependent formaldehyde-activating enzyme [Colletotrichum scovillei]KAG7068334.1 glutathione-dependent formaldehyde-activating enzyme [Colletotrichum scovillei]
MLPQYLRSRVHVSRLMLTLAIDVDNLKTLHIHPVENTRVNGMPRLRLLVPVLRQLHQITLLLLAQRVELVGDRDAAVLAKRLCENVVAEDVAANLVVVSRQHDLVAVGVHPDVSILFKKMLQLHSMTSLSYVSSMGLLTTATVRAPQWQLPV